MTPGARPPLAVTIGEPSGVGPDVTLAAYADRRDRPLPVFFLLADPDMLSARVAKAAEADGVLRLKGFAAVPGKPMRLVVQGVGRRVSHHFDRAWGEGEARDGRLTVIGLKGFDLKAVEAALAGA